MSNMKVHHGNALGCRNKEIAALIPFGDVPRRVYDGSRITAEEAETRLSISQAIRVLFSLNELSSSEFILADWLLIPTSYGRKSCSVSADTALNGDDRLPPVGISRSSYFRGLRNLEKKGLISRKHVSSSVEIRLHIDPDAALLCFRMWKIQARVRSE